MEQSEPAVPLAALTGGLCLNPPCAQGLLTCSPPLNRWQSWNRGTGLKKCHQAEKHNVAFRFCCLFASITEELRLLKEQKTTRKPANYSCSG